MGPALWTNNRRVAGTLSRLAINLLVLGHVLWNAPRPLRHPLPRNLLQSRRQRLHTGSRCQPFRRKLHPATQARQTTSRRNLAQAGKGTGRLAQSHCHFPYPSREGIRYTPTLQRSLLYGHDGHRLGDAHALLREHMG